MSMLSRKFSFAAAVTAACALPISRPSGEKIVAAFHDLAEPFDVFMLGQ